MFLFIKTVCFRSQSRSVFAWTPCTLASASSSPLIRVMNKRWWMAKKKIKFQLVACIKESDGKQTGEKLLFFITFGAKKKEQRDMSRMNIFISRLVGSHPAKSERLNESHLGEEKNCRRFSRKHSLFMMLAGKWRNCINTLKRNLFNDARDAGDHLGRVLRNFICRAGPAVNLLQAKLARESFPQQRKRCLSLPLQKKPFLDLIQTQKVSKL